MSRRPWIGISYLLEACSREGIFLYLLVYLFVLLCLTPWPNQKRQRTEIQYWYSPRPYLKTFFFFQKEIFASICFLPVSVSGGFTPTYIFRFFAFVLCLYNIFGSGSFQVLSYITVLKNLIIVVVGGPWFSFVHSYTHMCVNVSICASRPYQTKNDDL